MYNAQTYHSFYNTEDPRRWGRTEMPQQLAVTQHWLHEVGLEDAQCVVLELGCGSGPLSYIHKNHIGLEFSFTALRNFVNGGKRVNGDMQALPLQDNSVDFIFSWAALEHVPYPERVLAEVERVLKVGGVALLAPAWHVRPWAAKGLPIQPYRALHWGDRIRKASIPLRDSLVWRALFAIPVRLCREICGLWSRELAFGYRRLAPNLQEFIYTDCDAFTSMDPHTAIMYFKSRAWRVLSHKTFLSRMLARHEPVVVCKSPHTYDATHA
jgi:ubiquinone/menaquinone biosynthesis C-methylase UbiE